MILELELIPAYVPPPGEFLKMELEARGWTQKDLAEIIHKPQQAISEIVKGKKRITAETSIRLASAFGTSADLWHGLEADYQLHLARQQIQADEITEISRRSRLHDLVPINELIRYGWVEAGDTLDELEQAVCDFLDIASPQETPAKREWESGRVGEWEEPEVTRQVAWVRRVEQLARQQHLPPFESERLANAIPDLLKLAYRASDVAQVPSKLQQLGVHFLIVPALSKTFIDGVAFYLEGHPVVALTLRHNRIDSFWFTLMHELAHIVLGHEGLYLEGEEIAGVTSQKEQQANQQAIEWLLPSPAFAAFVEANRAHFTRRRIESFAEPIKRHPGIVVGRLKQEKLLNKTQHRVLQVKVGHLLDL